MSSNFKKSYKHIQYLKIDKSHVKWVNIIIIILKNRFYKSKTDWDNDFNPFPATKLEKLPNTLLLVKCKNLLDE